MSISLRWAPFANDSEIAYLGGCQIGMIGPMAADPETWFYSVDGVNCSHLGKTRGHVRGKASARRGVERIFTAWATRAGLL